MKKFITLFIFLTVFFTKAQTESNPIKIETSVNKISETAYDIIFNIKLYEGWYLYSQYNPENASLPLEISIPEDATGYKLIGNPKEEETFKKYSDVWEVEEVVFKDKAKITQRIQLTNKDITQIKINFFGQVCETACINIDENFIISLSGATITENNIVDKKSKLLTQKLKLDLKNNELLKSDAKVRSTSSNGLSSIFLLGFVGGLLALLTPCVFPMIPLTVSFFTKQTHNKRKGIFRAVLYGFFIVIIYILLSLPFHFLDNLDPEILNTISTNVWLNVFFFSVLVFFAFSFFGFYEITLPSSWGNKMDSASSVGGVLGIFFMALTLAIVSFSCTGPILGSLLASSLTADGGATQLTAGMTGFGLALALPFALFALFPNWLNALPKSGGWMNTTKVVLGFLELALAFKFLSNADLVAHWDLLKREVFIAIWILISIGLALYLFAKIKFPHDTPIKKLSFSRISFGVLVIAFSIYLIPGVLKNKTWNLSLVSGFPPPQFYSIYEQETDCPLGLDCYTNFDEGLAKAKAVNKPILLDFTGWACVNCRKMEENVWSELDIFEMLKNDYILISLYVDDNKKELPKNQKFDFLKENGKLKKIKTVGDKCSTFQSINFKNASQPYYVLLSPELEVLNTTQQYTDKETYYAWLKKGLTNFKK